jgi:hypothetical protein
MALSVSGCYQIWGNKEEELKYLKIAEEEAKIANDYLSYFYVLQSKMDKYLKGGQFYAADSIGKKVLGLNKETDYKVITASTYFLLSQTAAALKQLVEEGQYLDSAMKYYQICGKHQQYYESLRQRILYSIYVRQDDNFLKKYAKNFIADYPKIIYKTESKDELHQQQILDQLAEYKSRIKTERIIGFSIVGLFALVVLGLGYKLGQYRIRLRLLDAQVPTLKVEKSPTPDQTLPQTLNIYSEEEERYLLLLRQLAKTPPEHINKASNDLILEIQNAGYSLQDILELLLKASGKMFPEFDNKITTLAPDLSVLEQQICQLIKLNIGSDAICFIYNITEASLRNRRSIIRGKLNLTRRESLESYLLGI